MPKLPKLGCTEAITVPPTRRAAAIPALSPPKVNRPSSATPSIDSAVDKRVACEAKVACNIASLDYCNRADHNISLYH